jgi:DNA-directed RNA polymerase specialized sigma24 family protein
MHPNLAQAIEVLQLRTMKEPRARENAILEEALDDLVRNPDRDHDPEYLARSAVARARTKHKRRAEIAPVTRELDRPDEGESLRERLSLHLGPMPSSTDHASHQLLMARDTIARSGLNERDLAYLRLVSAGLETSDIAAVYDEPVSVVQVRLSRARSHVREIWQQPDASPHFEKGIHDGSN